MTFARAILEAESPKQFMRRKFGHSARRYFELILKYAEPEGSCAHSSIWLSVPSNRLMGIDEEDIDATVETMFFEEYPGTIDDNWSSEWCWEVPHDRWLAAKNSDRYTLG